MSGLKIQTLDPYNQFVPCKLVDLYITSEST